MRASYPTCLPRPVRAKSSLSEIPETWCRLTATLSGGVTAGVEYANLVLKVPLIIVCGHTDCGVMKALLHPETTAGLPGVQQWMRHGNEAGHKSCCVTTATVRMKRR